MKQKYECGIDLGTTNSCLAIVNEENECEVIENVTDRMKVTPSAVQVSKTGRITVGQRAYTYPDGRYVKKEFKRDMGYDTVYEFPESEKRLTPVELSAEVLKRVKRDAESRLNREISSSVITVPAAFQELQIKATKEAADIAGFKNVILLQEPVAAAVAYGAKASDNGENWLVFDYGGGTLDVAVVTTKNGELAAINNKGNNRMGGKDIDKALYERIILPKLQEKYQIEKDLSGQAKAKAIFEAEKCKMELSRQDDTIFELFEVEDDAGEEIEFELTITREEFDKAIYEIVDETISIARDALIGARLTDEELNKIVLVGGSTYIPLVRDKLKEEFNVELDCSLDPMTVVARGAAMYADQNYMDTDGISTNTEANNKDGIDVEFEFDDRTMETKTSIFGKFVNYRTGTIDKIKMCSQEDGLWQGGWAELLDPENGVFEYEVNIYNMDGENKYVMSAVDASGTIVKLSVPLISIMYGGGLKLAAPPLPFNMGIMTADSTGNFVDWLLRKNTRLPSAGHGTYKLNKTLNPRENADFTLKVFEGEDTYNPNANHLIGEVKVNSGDLPRALAEGEEIEITLDVDISRVVTVSAYIPKFDYVLTEEKIMGGQTKYVSINTEIVKVKNDMDQTRERLEKLRREGHAFEVAEDKLEVLEQQAIELGENADNDEAQQLLDDFRDLESDVIEKVRETRDSAQDKQDLDKISNCEMTIAEYGNERDRISFDDLKSRYFSENDAKIKMHFLQKMMELSGNVRWNSFEWLKGLYYYYKENRDIRYKDIEKANYWMSKAYDAVLEGNKEQLARCMNNVIGLAIFEDGEDNNRIDLADIRI